MYESAGQKNFSDVVYPLKTVECSKKMEGTIERYINKEFSKSTTMRKIEEYKTGKYSKKYIEVYLDFVHLEGVIDNLQYLELKKELQEVK